MNQQQIEQYVAGRMSEEEVEAFESQCVANPELARQVELEQLLRAGLAQVARGDTAEFVKAETTNYWKYAAAASIVLLLGAAIFAWRMPAQPARILTAAVTGQEHAGAGLRLALVRGSGTLPRLPAGPVRVEIVGLFDPEGTYSIALDHFEPNESRDTVDALTGHKPASPMTLEIVLDGDRLESGTYALRVRRQSSDEEPLEFRFVKP